MKAITVKQPWASLIVNGIELYEFRSWKTIYSSNYYAWKLTNVKKYDIHIFIKGRLSLWDYM